MNRLTLLFVLLLFSCNTRNETEVIVGDLYFSFFRVGNYYNQPDSLIVKYENYFLNTNFDTVRKEEKELFEQYELLKKHNLLYKPFVELLTGKDSSIVKLYLEKQDYDRIKIHKRQNLQNENEKVRIVAKVMKIDKKLFRCMKLDSVLVVEGKTYQIQKKLKIEDYD